MKCRLFQTFSYVEQQFIPKKSPSPLKTMKPRIFLGINCCSAYKKVFKNPRFIRRSLSWFKFAFIDCCDIFRLLSQHIHVFDQSCDLFWFYSISKIIIGMASLVKRTWTYFEFQNPHTYIYSYLESRLDRWRVYLVILIYLVGRLSCRLTYT